MRVEQTPSNKAWPSFEHHLHCGASSGRMQIVDHLQNPPARAARETAGRGINRYHVVCSYSQPTSPPALTR